MSPCLYHESLPKKNKSHCPYSLGMSLISETRRQDGTRLSAHIWELKDSHLKFDIDWETAARAKQFNPETEKMVTLPH